MNKPFEFRGGKPLVSEQAGVVVKRVGVHLGAEVSGVDLRRPLSEAQFKASRMRWSTTSSSSSAIRTSHPTISWRSAAASAPLTVHPFAPNEGKNAPELIKFRNDEKTPPFGTDVWHSDETFRAEPPMATMLVAKEVPAVGGDTMFVSMAAAYDGLSDRMQQFISGLEGIHDMKPFRPLFGKSQEERKQLQQFELMYPPQLHPVVRIHPVSGKKVLFVNPQFTVGINGMEEHESRALLDLLFRQALVPEYQFRHALGAAYHRDVGQPLDPALRGARLLPAAPLYGAGDHQRRAGDRRAARGAVDHPPAQIRRAGRRRHARWT